MDTAIYLNGKQCNKIHFEKEETFENTIYENSKLLFGSKTVLLSKKLIKTVSLGNTIPDGFLFDLSDVNNPQFYLIEIELAHHKFYDHIFPQITKFIAFFKSPESRKNLIDKLFEIISQNKDINSQFRKLLGAKEVFKAVTDGIENSQNILLILDEPKPEVEETKRAYSEWAKLVRVEVARFYKHKKENIITLSPPFEKVELEAVDEKDDTAYDEHFHLEPANDEVRNVYETIKSKMLKFDKNIRINPQRYYISLVHSRNFTFITIKKTKLTIVVTIPYNAGRKIIKKHKLTKLGEGVQNFYNSRCFRVTVEDTKNIGEVINLLKLNYKRTIVE